MNVTDYVKRLPSIKIEDKSVDNLFLNGCGMGVDGLVCKYVNVKSKRSKLHFLKSALKAFFNFKKINVDVNVDGKEVHFKNVWLCCVMNGPYEGGGMKMSPNSNRLDDDLEVVVVHSIKSLFIAFIFPIIYLGWHINLKRYVYTTKGKKIAIKSNVKTVLQYDGQTIENVDMVEVGF
jgi:diacylglycerol kinase family enzyme